MRQLPPREFVRAVRDYIQDHELLVVGDRVVIGVSGGPDSMALLRALHELAAPLRLRLHAAHLDHGLRSGAKRDAAFVAQAAAALNLPCTVAHERVRAVASRLKMSVEEAGRHVRYRFLAGVARRIRATRIAVGHHADDQAETVLMRLVRGAAAGGLAGMAPGRRLAPGVTLIRPLLGMTRADVAAYLRWRGVAFRRDPSNASRDHLRNRIRHDLLPLLERRYNPDMRGALARAAQVLAEESALLEGIANTALARLAHRAGSGVRLDAARLARLSLPIRRRVLRLVALKSGADPRRLTQAHLAALVRLAAARAGAVDLPAVRATRAGSVLRLTRVS